MSFCRRCSLLGLFKSLPAERDAAPAAAPERTPLPDAPPTDPSSPFVVASGCCFVVSAVLLESVGAGVVSAVLLESVGAGVAEGSGTLPAAAIICCGVLLWELSPDDDIRKSLLLLLLLPGVSAAPLLPGASCTELDALLATVSSSSSRSQQRRWRAVAACVAPGLFFKQ